MTNSKEAKTLQLSWGRVSEFANAVRLGDTIYFTGQITHDEESVFGRFGEMEVQMRQIHSNVEKVLKAFGVSSEDIVDVSLFVKDMEAGEAAWNKCRQDICCGFPELTSSLVRVERSAFPDLLIEIKGIARAQ
jgi:2-iminobutanoate/2-iminopropanoate deaminase